MKKLANTLSLIVALIVVAPAIFAQTPVGTCTVDLTSLNDSILCGDSVYLTADGRAVQIQLAEDFNLGALSAGWQGTAGVSFNNPCGNGPNGSTDAHMWMGSGISGNRSVATVDFDLTCGGYICFDFRMAIQSGSSPCEGPDQTSEGIYLQYSNNGGTSWNTIYFFDPDTLNVGGGSSSPFVTWGNYCFNIPPGAQTAATQIRWYQINTSGSGYDHWGIDNVEISTTCGTGYTYHWYNIDSTQIPPTVNYMFQDSGNYSYHDTVLYGDLTYAVMFFNNVDTCYDTLSIDVLDNPIEATLSDPQICYDGDTAIVTVTGGNTYTWTVLNGDPINVGNNIGCNNCDSTWLSPGVTTTYMIGSDLTGICHEYDTITLETVTVFDAGFDFNDPVCVNGDTLYGTPLVSGGTFSGSAIVDPSGVFVPSLTNGGQIPVTYSIPGSCANDSTMYVEVTPLPDATITSPDEFCIVGGPYQLTAATAGGTWSGPGITDPINGEFDPSSISLGSYQVTYTLTQPCFNQDSMTINVITPFDPEITPISGVICVSDTADTLTYNVATGPYSGTNYTGTWSGPGIIDPNNGVFNASLAGVGVHSVTVTVTTPGGGCSGTDVIDITVYGLPDASFSPSVYCEDVNATEYLNPATPGIGSWSVTPVAPTTSTLNINTVGGFVPATEGAGGWVVTYELTGQNGCYNSYSDTVRIAEVPETPIEVPTSFCAGEDVVLIVDGSVGDSIIWYDAAAMNRPGDSVATGDTVYLGMAQTGVNERYWVTASNYGCESSPLVIDVTVNPSPYADFTINYVDTLGNYNSYVPAGSYAVGYAPLDVEFSVVNPQPNEGYTWSFWLGCDNGIVGNSGCPCPPVSSFDTLNDGSIDYTTVRPVEAYSYGCEGSYPAALIVENEYGCRDTAITQIDVIGSSYIYNVFTPNGDGQNDYFQVVKTGLVDYKLTIYNRWGRKVYEQTESCFNGDPYCGWDGKVDGTPADDGVYFWVVEGTTTSGNTVEDKGNVTLIGSGR